MSALFIHNIFMTHYASNKHWDRRNKSDGHKDKTMIHVYKLSSWTGLVLESGHLCVKCKFIGFRLGWSL